MGTTIQDYRRTDLRLNLNGDPSWIVSRVVDGHEVSGLCDKACVLFSFPVDGQQIIVHEIVVKVLKAFTTGTTLDVGTYTLATDGVSTNDEATLVSVSSYKRFVESEDITSGSAGSYYPTSGDFVDSRASGVVIDGGNLIVGASTDVPAIVLTPSGATITQGQAKVLLLVSVVP